MNDGAKYIGDPDASTFRFNTPTVFDNLIHEGSMPVTIGVFIGPGSSDGQFVTGGDAGRSTQYDTANDQYGKFLLDEFLPSEILPNWDIVTDADGWAIGGHSSGGNASFSAAWFYPDRIRKVLAASATMSLTGGVFPDALLEQPVKPLRVYRMSGSNDAESFGSNNEAAENLMTMGYHYRYRPRRRRPRPTQRRRFGLPGCAALALARLQRWARVSRLPYSCAVGRNRMLP